MSDWQQGTLEKFFTLKRGYDLSGINRMAGDVPVISSSGVTGYHFYRMSKAPGVITGRYGTIGKVFYSDIDYWPLNTTLYVNDFKGQHPKFIYYFLKTFDFQKFNDKSTVPGINRNHIHIEQITVPPLAEQEAIAEVLSSLDDKIELLHRQNKTLEQMAETLFRQWFVENPSESWVEKTVADCIKLVGGGTPNTNTVAYWDGEIKWLSGKDVAANHKGFALRSEKSITQIGLNNCSAKLMPKFATVISARGTVGKFCLLSEEMCFSQSNYGILPLIKNTYFYTFLLISELVDELMAVSYGTVFDTITTRTFSQVSIKCAPQQLIKKFEILITPIFEKRMENTQQIQNLETLRDTLLPKLMSGAVRVKTT